MILDSSAVIAVIRGEESDADLVGALKGANLLAMGAPTSFETEIVAAGRWGDNGRKAVARFREQWDVEVLPFDDRHVRAAVDAFARYGKGRHPAALNFGDCMTYASARIAQLPLLFTGNDFSQTDLELAI